MNKFLIYSGGLLLNDVKTGPNSVEIIAWASSSNSGLNGNYSVYVSFYSNPIPDAVSFDVAVMESFQQGLKY